MDIEEHVTTSAEFCEHLLSFLEQIAAVAENLEDDLKRLVAQDVFLPYLKSHGKEQAQKAVKATADYMLGFLVAIQLFDELEKVEASKEDWAAAVEKATGEEVE